MSGKKRAIASGDAQADLAQYQKGEYDAIEVILFQILYRELGDGSGTYFDTLYRPAAMPNGRKRSIFVCLDHSSYSMTTQAHSLRIIFFNTYIHTLREGIYSTAALDGQSCPVAWVVYTQ